MTTGKKAQKKDPDRYQVRVPAGEMRTLLIKTPRPSDAELCKEIEEFVNRDLRERCRKKEFEETAGNCTAGGGATAPVDLVVVIDTSGSMSDEAQELSAAASAAIQAAQQSCPSDLKVAWFGIEGDWTTQDPATKFTQSYRDYLHGLGVPDADIVGTVGDSEDGAAAVMDLSDHFDWRPGAARAIFYLGDEALEGGDPQNADDVTAATSAIATANAQGVTVFTYFGTPFDATPNPVTVAEYARLATQTGGQAFTAPVANLGGFQSVLEQIICASGGEACQKVDEPKVVPCIRLRWGDGPNDRIETDDTEILCITVCNPYCNVTLTDFTLQLALIGPSGAVPTLPDGTPSVKITPDYMICFGDIPPCDPDKPDQPSCVSREVVLISCGAKEGGYTIFIAYCFEACFTKLGFGEAFKLKLVRS